MRKIALASVFGCFAFSLAATAFAQSEEFDKKPDDQLAADKQNKDEAGKKMPGEKDKPPPADPNSDLKEDPSKSYKFIDLRFRDFIVPKFMIDIFASGGTTVNVFSFGPELSMRKDRVEYDFALSYWDFSMNEFMFKGKSDPDTAYEIVSSTMKSISVTLDLLYDFPIDDKGRFDFLIGGGVGLMGIFGDLHRNQATPNNPSNTAPDRSNWTPCAGKNSPNNGYCDSNNEHYGSYTEPSWANGGSKPFILPYISLPELSFRFKPIKQLQSRADVGFSLYGFYLGLSAGYALPF
jgi:hypothetical protein